MKRTASTNLAALLLVSAFLWAACGSKKEATAKMDDRSSAPTMHIHELSMKTIDGQQKALGDFAGRSLLIVNTASECGLTPQYEGLETLWKRYGDKGLTVLGVPSNDFGAQEPGSDTEIQQFCTERFQVSFPMLSKVTVKGDDKVDLYQILTEQTAPELRGPIKWNFTKFLVDPSGKVVQRFEPTTEPLDPAVTGAIEAHLPQGS